MATKQTDPVKKSILKTVNNLGTKDFYFIDDFCKQYKVPEGRGLKILLSYFMAELKRANSWGFKERQREVNNGN